MNMQKNIGQVTAVTSCKETDHKENLLRYIWLSNISGFGVVSQNRLLELCGNIERCFSQHADDLVEKDRMCAARDRIGRKRLEIFLRSRDLWQDRKRAEAVIEECGGKDIDIITGDDARYPERFAGLPDMPVVLYAKGKLRINDFARSSGIIGARRCTENGKQSAIEITYNEVKEGTAIISGMAKGIDSYAHTATLKKEGYTIAVLGNGVDICYPEEHKRLYEAIAKEGCIVSEYPPGKEARNYSFPRRNRLIAALSDILFVIDAGSHSGTESTIKACELYGKRVLRVYPNRSK